MHMWKCISSLCDGKARGLGAEILSGECPPSRLTSHGACERKVALCVEDRRMRRLSTRRTGVVLHPHTRRFVSKNLGILWIHHQPQVGRESRMQRPGRGQARKGACTRTCPIVPSVEPVNCFLWAPAAAPAARGEVRAAPVFLFGRFSVAPLSMAALMAANGQVMGGRSFGALVP
jgi:hypothetical protein